MPLKNEYSEPLELAALLVWVDMRNPKVIMTYTPKYTVKSVLSGHSKRRPNMVFNTDYCFMQIKSIAECSSTFIKLSFVIKIFVLSIFDWSLKTGFTVWSNCNINSYHARYFMYYFPPIFIDSSYNMYLQVEWKTVWILISWLLRSQLIWIYTVFKTAYFGV